MRVISNNVGLVKIITIIIIIITVALTDPDKFYQQVAVFFFLRFFQISGNSPQVAIFFRLILPFHICQILDFKKI